jgi:uncharacterized protein YdaU (DUF1376 family)
MPLYVADYLADTGHLTTTEHGAYLLLIMHYWTNGSLPDDDRQLARIARLDPRSFAKMRDTLANFFDTGWKHKRIDQEHRRAVEKSEKAKASINKRWEKSKYERITDEDTKVILPQSQSQLDTVVSNSFVASSEIDTAPRKASRAKPRSQIPEDAQPAPRDIQAAEDAGLTSAAFRAEWDRFRNYHRAKGSLMADWSAAWRTWLGNVGRFAPSPGRGPPNAHNGKTGGFSMIKQAILENERANSAQNNGFGRIVQLLPGDGQQKPAASIRHDDLVFDDVGRLLG